MYASIKPWINVPVAVKPYEGRTATGDKKFGEQYEVLCYPQGEVNIVRNWQGVEVVSHNHLYMEGDTKITKLDNVIFEGEGNAVPAIYTSLGVKREDGSELILEVEQHVGEDTVRCVAMESTDGLQRFESYQS